MAVPYARQTDLLLGDMALSSAINLDDVLRAASDEIDAKLGEIYVVPLVGLASHHQTLIKLICARLASGRLILAMAVGGEDRMLQAYGQSLIDDANRDLNMIATGKLVLTGVTEQPGVGAGDSVPGIINYDDESPMGMFENFAMKGQSVYWEPGKIL